MVVPKNLGPPPSQLAHLSAASDPSLDESDRLVLAYRLARDLPSAATDAPCVVGTYRLGSPRAGASLASPLLVSERRGVQVRLTEDSTITCPLALENGSDR